MAAKTRIVVGKIRPDPENPAEELLPIKVMAGKTQIGGAVVFEERLPGFGRVARIEAVSIYPRYHRRGIGTRLYEAAARAACNKFGAPLASTGYRTAMSEGFWQKQVVKGRAMKATILKPTPKHPRGRKQVVFMLSCPAPTSLKGVRRGS